MKILVTGSSGTIGTRLCERLLADGRDVVGANHSPNKWLPAVNDITEIVELCDHNELSKLPSDIDIIVHLAANARVYELVEHPDRALDNIISTYNILEYAREAGVKKIIFASSRETYGNIKCDEYTEDLADFRNTESPYTASKIAGEALIESYQRCYDIDHVTLRFSNVYGMYDDSVRVVPLFYRLAKGNEPLSVFGKDKCLDFTYIDDTVDGIITAIDKFDDIKNDVYNLAYGEGTTIMNLAEKIVELTGSSSEITSTESRRGEVTHYIANIDKARQAFGYSPQVSFEEGITKTVEWYNENT